MWLGLYVLGAATAKAELETHANLQAVQADGTSAWEGSHPVTLRGVLLNDPEEWLDSAWVADAEARGVVGGQWQIVFQAASAGDRGGTACWMGQNYSYLPWVPEGESYSEAQWAAERERINHDPDTGRRFRKGDLIEVTAARTLFFGGKRNITEAHRVDPAHDFSITLLRAAYGLPDPEVITLADLVRPYDGDPATKDDLFDATRQSGGEFYQGLRVRIESLRLATPQDYLPPEDYYRPNFADRGWDHADGTRCTVTDGEGRFFTLRIPLTDLGPKPEGWFSAVGILNQDSGSGSDGTYGYELFVQEIGPTLRLTQTDGRLLFFWPATYSDYVLQHADSLEPDADWQRVEGLPAKWLLLEKEPAETEGFYRLIREPSGPSPLGM